jgi:hypothetical protein
MSAAAPLSTAPPPTPAAVSVAAAVRCANCGAAVAQRYCSACGQRLEPPVHTLWHFAQVATVCGKLLLLAFFYLVSGTLMLALTTAYSALPL